MGIACHFYAYHVMILLNVIGINFWFHTLSQQIIMKKQFRDINQNVKTGLCHRRGR